MLKRILIVSVSVLIMGCGKSDSPGTVAQGNYYGSESGTRAGQQISSSIILSLAEQNQQVTGSLNITGTQQPTSGSTYSASAGATGSVSGVIIGTEIRNFILVLNDASCKGNLIGKGTINGMDVTASFSGTTSCGEVSISISARRQ